MKSLVLILLLCASTASAAEVGDVFGASSGGAATSLQIPVIMPALPNVTLGVCVGTERSANQPAAISAAKLGSQDLASAAFVNMNASSRTQRAELFYLPAPLAGSGTVTLALPAGVTAARIHAFAFVLTDVAPTAPEVTATATVSGGVITTNPITATPNGVLVDCLNLGISATANPTGGGHSKIGNFQDSEQTTALGSVLASNVGTYPMGWQWTPGTRAAQVLAAFTKAPPPPPTFDPTVDWMPPTEKTGLINVLTDPHCPGIVNDGVTDVTAALQNCVTYYANHNKLGGDNSKESEDTLCLPKGDYLTSGQVQVVAPDGVDRAYMGFRGCTNKLWDVKWILAANSVGYEDVLHPKPVLRFGNPGDLSATPPTCCTGSAARNFLNNIWFDIREGNPGAEVVHYVGNNMVSIRNLKITAAPGSCYAGLTFVEKWPGPVMIKNLDFTGCATGLIAGYSYANLTFEDVTLRDQTAQGAQVYLQEALFHNLTSIQSIPGVPALLVQGQSTKAGPLVNVLDATFTGSGPAAIKFTSSGASQYKPQGFFRNVTTSGYTNALDYVGSPTASLGAELATRPTSMVFPSPTTSLNLPIPPHPHMMHPNPLDWASIAYFGAVPNDGLDDTAAIQAAIDSGKKVVYCPAGIWTQSDSIHLRGAIERLVGFDCFHRALGNSMRLPDVDGKPVFKPAFIADETLDHDVEIENIRLDRGDRNASPFPEPRFIHKSHHAVILTDVLHVSSYVSEPGAGTVFVEDSCCDQFRLLGGNDGYFRSLNVEDGPTPNSGDPTGYPDLEVAGGTAVSMGFKNENRFGPFITARAGAKLEAFGSFFYSDVIGGTSQGPIFECLESQCVHSYLGYSGAKWNPQGTVIRDGTAGVLPVGAPGSVSRSTFNTLFVERPLPVGLAVPFTPVAGN